MMIELEYAVAADAVVWAEPEVEVVTEIEAVTSLATDRTYSLI